MMNKSTARIIPARRVASFIKSHVRGLIEIKSYTDIHTALCLARAYKYFLSFLCTDSRSTHRLKSLTRFSF